MNDVAAEHGSWLTPLPSRWRELRLKYIASCNDEVLQETTPEAKKIEYVDIGSVSSTGDIVSTETILFVDAPSRARRMVRQGDVLVSTVRTYLKAIAPVRNAPKNLIASTGFAVIRSGSGAVSDYLAYVLRAEGFIGEVISRSVGISYPAINASDLVNICIPAPPMGEQTQIARFLDYETAKIDALIEKQQQLIALLKEKRQAVISHAVTKGLNPDAPLRDSGVEWLGEVPAHWEVAPLKYKCELIDGDRSSAYPGEEDLVDEGIPFVSSKNISDFRLTRRNLVCITQEKFDQLRRGKLQPDDLVITVRGTIGNVGVFYPKVMECDTAFINAQMMIMRPIAGLTAFLELVCQSFVWQEQLDLAAYGSTVRQLSNQVLGNVKIVLPPSHEVDVLVNATIEKVAKINSLVAAAQSAEGLLQERRTALISAAVTGKIDVRNWQSPDDE